MVRFFEACQKSGIERTLTDDIERDIWEKFIFLSSFSGLTSLCRRPIGVIRADEDARALFEGAVHEVAAVARASGVSLPPDAEEKTVAFADGLPADMTSSMLRDLQAGKRLELPWLSGEVVRRGRRYGLPTPVHTAVYGALKFDAG